MIAGFQECHERAGNGAEATGERHGAISSFELGYCLFECMGCWGAFTAIGDAFERAARAVGTGLEQGLQRREDDRRRVIDWRIDYGVVSSLVASRRLFALIPIRSPAALP